MDGQGVRQGVSDSHSHLELDGLKKQERVSRTFVH